MHEWVVPIHSTQLEGEHTLEAGLHTRVPWEVHMVVEHPLVTHLWMLEKINCINRKYKIMFSTLCPALYELYYLFVCRYVKTTHMSIM